MKNARLKYRRIDPAQIERTFARAAELAQHPTLIPVSEFDRACDAVYYLLGALRATHRFDVAPAAARVVTANPGVRNTQCRIGKSV